MSRQTGVNNINRPQVSTLDVKNIFTVDPGAVTEHRSYTHDANIVRDGDVLQGSRKSGLAPLRLTWLGRSCCPKSARIAEQ